MNVYLRRGPGAARARRASLGIQKRYRARGRRGGRPARPGAHLGGPVSGHGGVPNPRSQISLRILSRRDEPIDGAFIRGRVQARAGLPPPLCGPEQLPADLRRERRPARGDRGQVRRGDRAADSLPWHGAVQGRYRGRAGAGAFAARHLRAKRRARARAGGPEPADGPALLARCRIAWRCRKTACAFWWMSRRAKRRAFSSTRRKTAPPSRRSCRACGCWTASRTRAALPCTRRATARRR